MGEEEFYQLLDKVVRYCAYTERCFEDVEQRLHRLGVKGENRQKIIDYLVEQNVVNEQRFAHSFTEGKFRFNKWGKIKISAHLRAKKIKEKHILPALDQIDQNVYSDSLTSLLLTKYTRLGKKDRFNKTVRYAQSKGYELPLIVDILNDIVKNKEI